MGIQHKCFTFDDVPSSMEPWGLRYRLTGYPASGAATEAAAQFLGAHGVQWFVEYESFAPMCVG